MEALFCNGPRQLSWRDVAEPILISPYQAIVAPLVVATCDIDAAMIAGQTPYRGTIALGHECIAEVIAIGDAVANVTIGDRVVVSFQINCGRCPACRRGFTGNCTAGRPMSMYGFGAAGGGFGGALADRLHVPYADAMLEKLPAGIDPTHFASLSDNLPDAYRAVAPPLSMRPGAAVLVVGGGCASIGLYAVMLARTLGAGSVAYLDVDQQRAERAARLGADARVGPYPLRAEQRYEITVDASANPDGLGCAIRSTAPDGVCTSTGGYFTDTTPLPLRDLYVSCGTLVTGRCHARPAIAPLLLLAAAGRLTPEVITSRVAPFTAAAEVLAEQLASGRNDKISFVRTGEVGS
jgi:threonine dehydrogenase-like Zn-dependent dehydrogenase